jgi:hypothetical protein
VKKNDQHESSKAERLQRWSHIATITASIVAVAALIFGTYQFRCTQTLQRENLDFERETKAVDLFIKYNDLKREASERRAKESKEGTEWQDNVLIGIAESIWDLRHEVPAWRKTVEWMLAEEDKSSKITDLGCDTYDRSFVEFARHAVGHEVCEKKNDPRK